MSQHIHRTITLILTERWTITWLSDDQVAAAHAASTSASQEAPIIVEYTQTVVCEVVEYIQPGAFPTFVGDCQISDLHTGPTDLA